MKGLSKLNKAIADILHTPNGFKTYKALLKAEIEKSGQEKDTWGEWSFLCLLSKTQLTCRMDSDFLFYLGEILTQPRLLQIIDQSGQFMLSVNKVELINQLIRLSHSSSPNSVYLGATFALAAIDLNDSDYSPAKINFYQQKFADIDRLIHRAPNAPFIGKAYLTLMLLAKLLHKMTQESTYIHFMLTGAKLASCHNEPLGQTYYGYFLKQGIGVEKNPALALELHEKAAHSGCVLAMRSLAASDSASVTTGADGATRRNWLVRAAEQGNADAQYNLGCHYLKAPSNPENAKEAELWLNRAAKQYHAGALNKLGVIALEKQDEQENKIAVHLLKQAARLENREAKFNLATLYRHGIGVAKSPQNAFSFMLAAAKDGLPAAQNDLGAFYEAGLGVAKNVSEALMWFKQAAANGDALAQHNLAVVAEREALRKERQKDYANAMRASLFAKPILPLDAQQPSKERRPSF